MDRSKIFRKTFSDKKITMLGLGVLGRGVNVAKFLAENGAQLIVTDLKPGAALASSLKKLRTYKNIRYVLGEHRFEDFRGRDMIIKAAGVPLDSPFIQEARKNKIPVEMDASLFARLAPTPISSEIGVSPAKAGRGLAPEGVIIVGITGTRGKTTVTNLIFEVLKTSGHRVFLGGNIRGVATLPLLKKVRAGDIVVLELDSWQLQGFGDAHISPHVAVFTNFLCDHMNYYKGDMERYFDDKANIFKYQKKGDRLILGEQVAMEIKNRGVKPKPRFGNSKARLWKVTHKKDVPRTWSIKIPGEHNLKNIACVIAACRALGVNEEDIKNGVQNFKGVPGRLELVRTVNGVRYYNDTTATTPDGNRVALEALKGSKKNIILIAGGNDKKLVFDDMARNINKTVKAVVFIKGTATDKLLKLFPKRTKYPISIAGSMKDAVRFVQAHARQGDIVLLSPGAASFGVFKNEYDRGDQFTKLVNSS